MIPYSFDDLIVLMAKRAKTYDVDIVLVINKGYISVGVKSGNLGDYIGDYKRFSHNELLRNAMSGAGEMIAKTVERLIEEIEREKRGDADE